MPVLTCRRTIAALVVGFCLLLSQNHCSAVDEPPALNPFGPPPNTSSGATQRDDAYPGYVELSNGNVYCGRIYVTRDKRLMINDTSGAMAREREVPLRAVKQIECQLVREWMEREWRFKEMANDEKVYTGRSYPSRLYRHKVMLINGKTIEGDLSGVFYLIPGDAAGKPGAYMADVEPVRFTLHKRDKGKMGEQLKDLLWVKAVKLGDDAFKEGLAKRSQRRDTETRGGKKPAGR